jgi:hypothetical protein
MVELIIAIVCISLIVSVVVLHRQRKFEKEVAEAIAMVLMSKRRKRVRK